MLQVLHGRQRVRYACLSKIFKSADVSSNVITGPKLERKRKMMMAAADECCENTCHNVSNDAIALHENITPFFATHYTIGTTSHKEARLLQSAT